MPRVKKEYENPKLVNAMFREFGIPEAEFEYQVHIPEHRNPFRLDIAWPKQKVYLEIQGGRWFGKNGGHTSGVGIKRNWIKNNWLTQQGWRGLYCEPKDWATDETFEMIKRALKYAP